MTCLKTNDVPREYDIPVIQETISAAEDRLRALDAQVLPLQVALAPLVQLRAEIAEHLRGHRAAVSPVRRVPHELICEIFDITTAQSRTRKPPWRLGWISSTWRQYALGHTPLWTDLSVSAAAFTRRRLDPELSRLELETQVLRCGTALLGVHWTDANLSRPNNARIRLAPPSFQGLAHCVI
ncbi:hypothetical protein C8R45DRAFT_1047377 [Mycena sanguinolenta]|nr:hypothetical protein C8R45DRAFT_1047377 [Mycena sanguinolenta]